jgi:hypothetical protein
LAQKTVFKNVFSKKNFYKKRYLAQKTVFKTFRKNAKPGSRFGNFKK